MVYRLCTYLSIRLSCIAQYCLVNMLIKIILLVFSYSMDCMMISGSGPVYNVMTAT